MKCRPFEVSEKKSEGKLIFNKHNFNFHILSYNKNFLVCYLFFSSRNQDQRDHREILLALELFYEDSSIQPFSRKANQFIKKHKT